MRDIEAHVTWSWSLSDLDMGGCWLPSTMSCCWFTDSVAVWHERVRDQRSFLATWWSCYRSPYEALRFSHQFFLEMASRAILMERTAVLMCSVFILIIGVCVGSPNHGRRLVCWKAILKCHGEAECRYAYDQYLYACASVISGERRSCPSHCISSLIQLNRTRSGPALEDCDCAQDSVCRGTKQAIEPCLPRTSTMGCTEALKQCEKDPSCGSAVNDYLVHCRKLFGGERCSDGCRRVIANMRSIPKAQQLETCVCDGTERNTCEFIKLSMETYCSDSSDRFAGSGLSDSEEDSEDDYIYQEDDQQPQQQPVEKSRCDSTPSQTALNVVTTILVLTTFLWKAAAAAISVDPPSSHQLSALF